MIVDLMRENERKELEDKSGWWSALPISFIVFVLVFFAWTLGVFGYRIEQDIQYEGFFIDGPELNTKVWYHGEIVKSWYFQPIKDDSTKIRMRIKAENWIELMERNN